MPKTTKKKSTKKSNGQPAHNNDLVVCVTGTQELLVICAGNRNRVDVELTFPKGTVTLEEARSFAFQRFGKISRVETRVIPVLGKLPAAQAMPGAVTVTDSDLNDYFAQDGTS